MIGRILWGVAGLLAWLALLAYVAFQLATQPDQRSTWNSKGMR